MSFLRIANGCQEEGETTKQAVAGTSAAVTLAKNAQYRITADIDCHVSINADSTAATSGASPLWEKTYDIAATTDTVFVLNVIRAGVDGNIWITRLHT